MSRKGRSTQSAVEKLVEQRRLIHDWLAKLRANVDGMPPHVIERVRNDYRARLDAVMAELAGHRDALREALEEGQERQEELEEQQQHRKDELSELKLRRQVGEMDEHEFKDQSGEMQATIDQIKKDLGATIRDIERYEEIMEVISAGEPPAGREETETREKEEPGRRAAEQQPVEPAPEPAREERPAAAAKPVDELAFLRSVTSVVSAVKPPTPAAPPPPPPAPKPAAAAAPPAPEPSKEAPLSLDAAPGLLNLPGLVEPKPAAPKPREPQGLIVVSGNEDAASKILPPPPPPPPAPAPPARTSRPVAASPAAVVPGSAPSAAASRVDPSVVQASLKCKECGAVNRPTEWYCEKCGAELAAF